MHQLIFNHRILMMVIIIFNRIVVDWFVWNLKNAILFHSWRNYTYVIINVKSVITNTTSPMKRIILISFFYELKRKIPSIFSQVYNTKKPSFENWSALSCVHNAWGVSVFMYTSGTLTKVKFVYVENKMYLWR